MEPIFKREPYRDLVPQVIIKAGEREVNLLDAGHRAGDAIGRFAGRMEGDEALDGKPLGERLWTAFQAWQEHGDAEPLARVSPTSLVFGAWDSRATQAKVPRAVRSVIRAYNVKRCSRSATFIPPLQYVDEGLIDESLNKGKGDENPLSEQGFLHNPAAAAHGGVEVLGEIRRDAALNLVALRALGVRLLEGETEEQSKKRRLKLRRYVLGLALVALTHRDDQQFNLREGCLLRIGSSSSWKAVPFEGEEQEVSIDRNAALSFAQSAASDFGVQRFLKPFVFDKNRANQWLNPKTDRDKLRRKGPAVLQDLK